MAATRWTIRRLLCVAIAAATLLLLAAGGWFTYSDLREDRAAAEQRALERATLIAASVADRFEDARRVLTALAASAAVGKPDIERAGALFGQLLRWHPRGADLWLVAADGTVLAGATPVSDPALRRAALPWLRRALESGAFVISDPLPAHALPRGGIVLAQPLRGADGVTDGLVAMVLDAARLHPHLSGGRPGAESNLLVLGSDDRILLRSDAEARGETGTERFALTPRHLPERALGTLVGPNGGRWLYALVRIPGTEWRLASGLSLRSWPAAAWRAAGHTLPLLVVATASWLILALGLGRHLVGRLGRLVEVSRRIAGGHWNVRVEPSRIVELDELGLTVELLAQKLRSGYAALEARNRILAFSTRTLDKQQIVQCFSEEIGPMVDCDRCAVVLIDEQRRIAKLSAAVGVGSDQVPIGTEIELDRSSYPRIEAANGFLIDSGLDTASEEKDVQLAAGLGLRSRLIVPLVSGSSWRGLLLLYSRREDAFSERHRLSVIPLADQLAQALTNVEMINQLRTHDAELESQRRELEELYRRLLHAGEEERRRVAVELHDELGQVLAGLSMRLAAIQSRARKLRPDLAREAGDCLATLSSATEAIRRITHDLRPVALSDLGLAGALKLLGQRWQADGLPLVISIDPGLPRLPESAEISLYRIAQELVTNAARHGQASQVQLRLRLGRECLLLEVLDNGVGFDTRRPPWGTGLRSIRERSRALGAVLKLDSEIGQGARIRIEVPLKHASDSEPAVRAAPARVRSG